MSVRHACILLLAAVVLLLAGCPQPPTTPSGAAWGQATNPPAGGVPGDQIVIGSVMCNTGSFATFGQSSTNAMRLAVDEVNSKGGVLGRKIKLIVEDDQCKADEAANAAQKLIQQDQVLCIVGEVVSTNSLAIAPICQAAGREAERRQPATAQPLATERDGAKRHPGRVGVEQERQQ